MIKERILDNGLVMINNRNTRNNKILDHFYTNNIEKIENIYIEGDTTSDHNMVIVNRKMKVNNTEETIIVIRNYKDLNYEEMNENIINEEDYRDLLIEEDPEILATRIIEMINSNMDKQSKERRIKVKDKKINKYTQETIDLINKKNNLYKEWVNNKTIENKNNLKNTKKILKSIKNKEDFVNKKNKFIEHINNPKEAWKESKNILYGNKNQVTDRIIENNTIKNGSKNVANTMNLFFL